VVRNRRALAQQRQWFGQPVQNRCGLAEKWCRTGVVMDGSGAKPVRFQIGEKSR
jgi:hypothetical protein